MALQKEIELENGIVLKYHRIESLNKITNISNIIAVNSYISEAQRQKEKEYQRVQMKNANGEELSNEEQQLLENGINVLVEADLIQVPYDEDMIIEDAYDYLKTTDKYKDAIDI